MILSLLVFAEASPAANARRPRVAVKANAPAPAEAGPTDPCAVGPTTSSAAPAGESPSAVPLATLLGRARNQTTDSTDPARGEQNTPLSKQLWSTRITIPETGVDTTDGLALQRLIHQVRSVKFAGKNTGPAFTAPAEPGPVAASSEFQFDAVQGNQTAAPSTASNEASATASNKTRKTLDMLQQNPDQVRDPLEMAELLFLSGRPAEAAPFYARALDRISRGDASYDSDRAWVLFQLGNCLRETDLAKAQEAYMKLVSEYPESPWTELAKAHGRLLTWYQKSQIEPTATTPRM